MERIHYFPEEDPKGKNYIFFAAHPEDKERFFHKLWNEITDIESNCVFWYDSQPDQPWNDSLTEMLDQTGIRLFVFPITYRLLTSCCNAISALLPYAMERNIPILPILLESKIETAYAQIFGDRQYMDKTAQDLTAIPFNEKLKRFLQETLLSKEMAEKIRQAFDAYIFLSYRKKDRALAANLMKLIHEIPQMRDVAIWYDEFLVPGEDFNDNIEKALDNCHLFTMAVTPNLVNEENYVLSTEYPKALTSAKPIAAVQLEETDPILYRQKLEAAVKGLVCPEKAAQVPAITNAYNTDALRRMLLVGLKDRALARNDDPMHNYLIGLAYLNGIDIETNHKKAVALITAAAEQNCPEAMIEVINMYHNGNGVERNIPLAIRWSHKLIEWKKQHIVTQEDALEYISFLRSLGTSYEAIRCFSEEKETYLNALKELDRLQDKLPAKEYLFQRMYLYESLVIVCGTLSHPCESFIDEGIRLAAEAGAATENLAEQSTVTSIEASLLAQKSRLYEQEKNYDESILYAKQSLQLYRESALAKGSFADRNIASLLCIIGSILFCSNDASRWIEAEKYMTEGVSLQRELTQKADTNESWEQLAAAYNNLGSFYKNTGRAEEAEKAYGECIEIYKILRDDFGLLSYSFNLLRNYHNMALLKQQTGHWDEAEALFQKAVNQIRRHKQEISSVPDLIDIAVTYRALGILYSEQRRWEKAEFWMNKSVRLLRNTPDTADTHRITLELSDHYLHVGAFYLKWQQAPDAYATAATIEHNTKLDNAESYLKEAHKLLSSISDERLLNIIQPRLMKCYRCFSVLHQCKRNFALETHYLEKSLEIATQIKNPSVNECREIAVAYIQYGNACSKASCDIYYLKACAIYENLPNQIKSSEDFYFWALALYHLGSRNRKKTYLQQAAKTLSCCSPSYLQEQLSLDIKKSLKR